MTGFAHENLFNSGKPVEQIANEEAVEIAEKVRIGASLLDYLWKYNT